MDQVLYAPNKYLPGQEKNQEIIESDQLKLLFNTQSVLLSSSKWNNNLLFRGKINLLEKNQGELVWSTPKEIATQKIKLKNLISGQIISGSKALKYIQNNIENSKGLKKENCVVILIDYTLCIVFDQQELCENWLASLKSVISQQSQQFFTEIKSDEESVFDLSENNSYGAIFDISESEQSNEMWKEIKITFVKEDFSHSEFLNFDLSQKNLHDSSQEVLSSIEDYTDLVNKLILESYLTDIITQESSNRIEKLDVIQSAKKLLPSSMKFKRKLNTKIRSAYLELEGNKLAKQVISMLLQYELNDHGQQIPDAFQLLYLQKLSFDIDLHQLACEHHMNSMRKSLNVFHLSEESEPILRRSESPGTIQKRIESIVQNKPEKPQKVSDNRGTCECLIY